MATVRPFAHQVAGHGLHSVDGLLSCTTYDDEECVLKPLSNKLKGLIELSFYRHITQHGPTPHALLHFIPAYHYTTLLTHPTPPTTPPTTPHNPIPYLALHDLTTAYHHPSVLDLKLGTRTFDESAQPVKQAVELAKYPLQAAFGLRIAGWKRWVAHVGGGGGGGGGWEVRGKVWGRSVQPHQMLVALGQFLGVASGPLVDARLRRVVADWLTQLRQLHAVFERQTDYRFYASSLLLMYEGDDEAELASASGSARVSMVDFGHVFGPHRAQWVSEQAVDQMPTSLIAYWYDSLSSESIRQQQQQQPQPAAAQLNVALDTSYLYGLSSLISLLVELLR